MCHSKTVASHDAMFRSAVDVDDQFCNYSVIAEHRSSSGLLDGFAFSNSSSMHHVSSQTGFAQAESQTSVAVMTIISMADVHSRQWSSSSSTLIFDISDLCGSRGFAYSARVASPVPAPMRSPVVGNECALLFTKQVSTIFLCALLCTRSCVFVRGVRSTVSSLMDGWI